jgi:hypothetical protein
MIAVFQCQTQLKDAVSLWISKRTEAELRYGHISKWDVSNVNAMNGLFKDKVEFNDDISDWDVRNVTDMSNMFSGAKKFNQPLYKWKISAETNRKNMFAGADTYNQWKGMSPMLALDSCLLRHHIPVELWAIIHYSAVKPLEPATLQQDFEAVLDKEVTWNSPISIYGHVSDWPLLHSQLYHVEELNENIHWDQSLDVFLERLKLDMNHRTFLAAAGFIPPLLKLVSRPSTAINVRHKALSVLISFATACRIKRSIDKAQQILIRESVATAPIILSLSDSDHVVRGRAVELLDALATDDIINEMTIRNEGGIVALIKLLCNTNETLLYNVLLALSKFINNPESRTAIREAGGIQQLLTLLPIIETTRNRIGVLNILFGLAQDEESNDVILTLGGIPQLLHYCSDKSEEVADNALLCIVNLLCCCERSRLAVIAEGGVKCLVNRFSDSITEYNYHFAAFGLSVIALRSNLHKQSILQHIDMQLLHQLSETIGEVGLLLTLLHDNVEELPVKSIDRVVRTIMTSCEQYSAFYEHVTNVLVQVCVHPKFNSCLSSRIKELLQLLSSKNLNVRKNTIVLLAYKLKYEHYQHFIVNNDIISVCLDLLKDPEAADVYDHVLTLLASISKGAQIDQSIVNTDGAVQRLVSFLTVHDVEMRQHAVMIVLTLTLKSIGKIKVQEVNGIEPLVKLLHDTDNYVRKCATQAICNLAYDNTTNQALIRQFGAIEVLIKSLIDDDVVIRKIAAAAISKRALNVLEADIEAMNLVEQMSLVSDRYGTTDPSKALMHLIRNEPGSILEVTNHDIIPLVILLSEDDLSVREVAANCLYCTSREVYRFMHEYLIEAKAISAVVQALSEERNSTLVNTMVKTLSNMSVFNNLSRDCVIDAGAIPLLVQLPANGDLQVSSNACNALYWLNYFDQPTIGRKWL